MTQEEQYDKAVACAARILSRRALSEKMLFDKLLLKEFPKELAEYAVERMKYLGAINDVAYAESCLRSLANRGYGTLRIKNELKKRGISREIYDAILSEHEPDIERLTAFLDKKLCGDLSQRKEIQKAAAALQRKGFRWEQISQALRAYEAQLEEK